MKRIVRYFLVIVVLMALRASTTGQVSLHASPQVTSQYEYNYKGKVISLNASKSLIAIKVRAPFPGNDRLQ